MWPADTAAPRRRGPDVRLTIGVTVALIAAMVPLLRVVAPRDWLPGAVLLAVVLLGAGYAARWRAWPALAVTGVELGLWVAILTFAYLRDSAFLWIIPSPASVREVPPMITGAMQEIVSGAAPLEPGQDLTFLLVASVGLLAIVLDHVVITARMPLLAAVGLVAVWLIPTLAVPAAIDVAAFAFLAVTILYLLRAETRGRQASAPPPPATAGPTVRRAGVGATAIGIGSIAIVVTVAVAPVLPAPTVRGLAGSGFGVATTIDPSLELGDDLRQLEDVVVLTMRTNAPTLPYLRAVTLSSFDGAVWEPDRVDTTALAEGALGEVVVGDDVRVTQYRTTVDVTDLASPWLPVAFPAVDVTGLAGDWEAMAYNRTVLSRTTTSQSQEYEVVTHLPRPTREQIRATRAGGLDPDSAVYNLPAGLPWIIAATAEERTAGATNDYDKLIALQSWFRGSDFEYSLDAPVAEGFDGTGADAIASFLTERTGYCVHFASAFAVMARTLGMPSRIVVGYLPGATTGELIDGQKVHEVRSDQLHAWPEVFFDGIGWVPFEPTKSLGTPTSFLSEAIAPTSDGGEDVVTDPSQALAPTPAPTSTGRLDAPQFGDETATGASGREDPQTPVALFALGALLVLAAPAIAREIVRRRRLGAAAGGDAMAAWTSVRETAIDLGIAVPAAETPRAFGTRLASLHGAPVDAVAVLVNAVERASYAPSARGAWAHGEELADAVGTTRAAMMAAAPRGQRILALALPRSLVMRPGSAYAAAAAP